VIAIFDDRDLQNEIEKNASGGKVSHLTLSFKFKTVSAMLFLKTFNLLLLFSRFKSLFCEIVIEPKIRFP